MIQLDPVPGTGDPVLPGAAPTAPGREAPLAAGAVGIGDVGWPDAFAERVTAAFRLAGQGEHATARAVLRALWDGDPGADLRGPLGRCLLAHHLAAVAEESADELRWHTRALQAGQLASDEECAHWGLPIPVRALFPLLHLRLAECHAGRGDFALAGVQLREGWTWAPALPRDSYGDRVRAGLDRLEERLELAAPPRGRHRSGRASAAARLA